MIYVLLFILIILLLMIFYPKERKPIKREYFQNKKNINLSLKPLLQNIPLLTLYYVGLI